MAFPGRNNYWAIGCDSLRIFNLAADREIPTVLQHLRSKLLTAVAYLDYSLRTQSQKGNLSEKKTELLSQSFVFCFFAVYKNKFLTPLETKKPELPFRFFSLRRKRDSNPRRCDPQQFSRLPHSTTLPFLRCRVTGPSACA